MLSQICLYFEFLVYTDEGKDNAEVKALSYWYDIILDKVLNQITYIKQRINFLVV